MQCLIMLQPEKADMYKTDSLERSADCKSSQVIGELPLTKVFQWQGHTIAVCCVKECDAFADRKIEDFLQLCIHALLVPPAPRASRSDTMYMTVQRSQLCCCKGVREAIDSGTWRSCIIGL